MPKTTEASDATEQRRRVRDACCADVKAERERVSREMVVRGEPPLTQRAVALKLGIKPGSYDQYERDVAPGMPMLKRLVNEVGFDAARLLAPLPDDPA